MDEFERNTEEIPEAVDEPQVAEEVKEIPENANQVFQNAEAVNEPINEGGDFFPENNAEPIAEPPMAAFEYSPVVTEQKKRQKNSKGLRIFVIVLAAIVLATGCCSVGYFYGRKSLLGNDKKHTEAVLAQRPANTDEMTEAQVFEKVNKSVVGIRIFNSAGAYVDASGVVYSKEGYIVSNDHIYAEFGAPKFKVYTYDGKEYDAEYVAGDQVSDLCVLKVKANDLIPAEFGDSSDIFSGEHVVAVGRPGDATEDSVITSGVISATRKRIVNDSNYASSYIQTDSAINPGSSGGALSNMYGQVIGITTTKLAGTQYDLVGFALPTVMMKRVTEDMLKNGKVTKRAKLGITYTEITSVYVEIGQYQSTGLLVASVSNDSDLYGKVNEGDVITHVNGQEITRDDIILDVIEDSNAGDTISITVVSKNGKESEYEIKLMENTGTSSYNPNEIVIPEKNNDDEFNENGDMPGGTFDFPEGN